MAKPRRPPFFEISSKRTGLSATAHLLNGEMVVQAGSIVRISVAGKTNETGRFSKKFTELVKADVLSVEGMNPVFVQDFAFSSPSAASSLISGYSSNGRKDWKLKGTNTTYAEWEAAQLDTEE